MVSGMAVGRRTGIVRLLVAVALTLGAVAFTPGSAYAARPARPVVYISTPAVSSAWPVSQAIAFMNRYTNSKLVRGRCQAGAPCVTISEKQDLGIPNADALTYPTYGSVRQGERAFRTSIVLGFRGRRLSPQLRLHTLVHELGHAFGIWQHNSRCTSVMYAWSTCGPIRFNAYELAILRTN
jgi:hypothetical protein